MAKIYVDDQKNICVIEGTKEDMTRLKSMVLLGMVERSEEGGMPIKDWQIALLISKLLRDDLTPKGTC